MAEQFERFALVFLFRVLLGVTAQVDTLAQVVQRRQVFTPVAVDALQHDIALEAAERFLADDIDLRLVHGIGRHQHFFSDLFVGQGRIGFKQLLQRHVELPLAGQHRFQALDVPLLFDRFLRHVSVHQVGEHAVAQRGDHFRDVGRFQQLVTLLVDHLALVVGDVIVFQQLLADVEVARFHLALGRFDRARDDARFDRFAFRHFQAVHHGAHAVAGEDAQQRVVERQVEARRTRITLAAGTATQLIVDAARFVAFGADDVQAARIDHMVVQRLPFIAQLLRLRWPCRRRQAPHWLR